MTDKPLVAVTSWPEAAVKARYLLELYAAGLPPEDARHRDLVAAVLEDFARPTEQGGPLIAAPLPGSRSHDAQAKPLHQL
ncbi:hypothetical protein I6F35_22205 [Bradyrhizobium sp. BRP22]|uniref:hypothetical protein n=1 Tax=Bradyrhizobium sp. BRP22 TaxID=2793821 RepID=UPI001CD5347A|nr:hypothetical protein [Bradyrhizobium sp. BRP22]MCA1455883.1 hypothetical protein [Bradyrhizobium sp. BRP22]